tara:strand:- start:256 stop:2175 length:1920 start_codon:yes stop_codon:yes gene_type:complete
MAYKLNKTDGSILVELVDGRLDVTSADIGLIGKNYQGFGETINENFIKMLENFSNVAAPSKPLRGQLWYDTSTGRLKVYDGTTFRSTDSTIYSATQPTELIDGDIWIDGSKDQLFFWNGLETVLVGPGYTKNQLRSGEIQETITSTLGQNKVVTKKYLNGSLYAIISKEEFTPAPAITGFGTLKEGYNISSVFPDFEWYGKASSAGQIVDEFGNVFDQNSFLSATTDDVTTGRITVANDGGIIIGNDSDFTLRVNGQTTLWQNNITDANFRLQLKDSTGQYTAVHLDTANKRLGIFNDSPDDDIVFGTSTSPKNLVVTGDLLVSGNQVSLDVQTLRVEDKQIELAIQDDSTLPSDAEVDDAGIVVRVVGDDKRWTWRQATDNWTSSHGINLQKVNDSYFIGGANVLNYDTLGTTVINSNLKTIGQLETLVVGASTQTDTMTLTEDRITTTANLELASVGSINLINSVAITNVATPTSARAVVLNPALTESNDNVVPTKGYVDDELSAATLVTGVDVTGLGSSYATGTYSGGGDQTLLVNIAAMLTELITPSGDINGKEVKIHAVYYTAATDPIDIAAGITKTLTAVDSAGTQNVSVVGDFNIADATADVTLTVNRLIISIKVSSALWDATTGVITASAL